MLQTDWVEKAEFRMEALRKAAEVELNAIDRDFPHWPQNDARRSVIMRLGTILFLPVVSLYTMRVHMHDPAWWEHYAPGSGSSIADPGRTAFDRGIKGKLILDLVGNLEHSFRLILVHLAQSNHASKFKTICESLFRTTNPHLRNVPADWKPTMELLRLIRNTVHTSWSYFPDNEKNQTVIFQGITYQFILEKPLNFISWDLLGSISESVLGIAVAVVRDPAVVCFPAMKDFGIDSTAPAAQQEKPQGHADQIV